MDFRSKKRKKEEEEEEEEEKDEEKDEEETKKSKLKLICSWIEEPPSIFSPRIVMGRK